MGCSARTPPRPPKQWAPCPPASQFCFRPAVTLIGVALPRRSLEMPCIEGRGLTLLEVPPACVARVRVQDSRNLFGAGSPLGPNLVQSSPSTSPVTSPRHLL